MLHIIRCNNIIESTSCVSSTRQTRRLFEKTKFKKIKIANGNLPRLFISLKDWLKTSSARNALKHLGEQLLNQISITRAKINNFLRFLLVRQIGPKLCFVKTFSGCLLLRHAASDYAAPDTKLPPIIPPMNGR